MFNGWTFTLLRISFPGFDSSNPNVLLLVGGSGSVGHEIQGIGYGILIFRGGWSYRIGRPRLSGLRRRIAWR